MKNKKGFTLVELLGIVTLMGILMGMGVVAYTRYIDNSKNKAYVTLRNSTISATEAYILENPDVRELTIEDLVREGFLEYAADPSDSTKQCIGKITIFENNDVAHTLTFNDYEIVLCCTNYYHTYTTKNKKDITNNECNME